MLAKFSGLNPKVRYVSLDKETQNVCVVLTNSIKRACEIRKFHVAVVPQGLRNVQKSVMHVQRCFLPILTYCFFAVRRRRCKNSLFSPSAESRKFGFMAQSRGTVETCHILIFD